MSKRYVINTTVLLYEAFTTKTRDNKIIDLAIPVKRIN